MHSKALFAGIEQRRGLPTLRQQLLRLSSQSDIMGPGNALLQALRALLTALRDSCWLAPKPRAQPEGAHGHAEANLAGWKGAPANNRLLLASERGGG